MDDGSNPHFFVRSLRRRWTVLLGALLLGIAASSLLVLTSTAEYRATSVVFLEPLVGNPYSPTTPTGRQEELAALTTEAGLVLADSVAQEAEEAASQAGVDLGPEVQERTSTEVPSNSQVIHVSFTAATPQAAQFGAEAIAAAYLDYRRLRSEDVLSTQRNRIDEEIASLTGLADAASEELNNLGSTETQAGVAEASSLAEQVRIYANQLAQLRIERVNAEGAPGTPGEIVSPARLPTGPEGIPVPFMAAVIVLVLLGAGVVGAVVLEHLDPRLRSRDEVEQLGLHPVSGPVPEWHPELAGTAAEDTYRMAVLPSQEGVHAVLGADGPVPVGVTAGLIHSLASMGHSVIVVLAVPGTADQEQGLSDVLMEPGRNGELLEVNDRIRLLGPGQHADALPSLVQTDRFPTVVHRLAEQCDTLVLVGAESHSATGAGLTQIARSTLLVCVAGQTEEADLQSAVSTIRDSGGELNGVLLASKIRRTPRPAHRRPGVDMTSRLADLLSSSSSYPQPEDSSAESPSSRHRSGRAFVS